MTTKKAIRKYIISDAEVASLMRLYSVCQCFTMLRGDVDRLENLFDHMYEQTSLTTVNTGGSELARDLMDYLFN